MRAEGCTTRDTAVEREPPRCGRRLPRDSARRVKWSRAQSRPGQQARAAELDFVVTLGKGSVLQRSGRVVDASLTSEELDLPQDVAAVSWGQTLEEPEAAKDACVQGRG